MCVASATVIESCPQFHTQQEAWAGCEPCCDPHGFILQCTPVFIKKDDLQLKSHHQFLLRGSSLVEDYLDVDFQWLSENKVTRRNRDSTEIYGSGSNSAL